MAGAVDDGLEQESEELHNATGGVTGVVTLVTVRIVRRVRMGQSAPNAHRPRPMEVALSTMIWTRACSTD